MSKKKFNKFDMLDNKGDISPDKFSNFLIKEHGIAFIEGQLSLYKEGAYVADAGDIEAIIDSYFPEIQEKEVRAVMYKIKVRAPKYSDTTKDSHLIALGNGVYDTKTQQLIPFSKDYIIPNKIYWNYDPKAYSEDIDKALEGIACKNKEVRNLLEEIVGYCMYRDLNKQVAFILVGPGGNGKSTYTDMIGKLLGPHNLSAVKLHQFSSDKDKFTVADLVGKLANIGDDIADDFITDTSTFKSATSGELIRARQIYGKPFLFKSYATMLFSAQNMPRIRSYDDGWFRRIKEVPLRANFKHDSSLCDPDLKERVVKGSASCSIDTMMSYLINLGLAGLQRVLTQGFTNPEICVEAKEEYIKECNPTLEWAEEYMEDNGPLHMKKRDDVYYAYVEWAERGRQKVLSKHAFVRFINEQFNMKVEPKYHADYGTVRTFVSQDIADIPF